MGTKLGITHTQLNIVALAGNCGSLFAFHTIFVGCSYHEFSSVGVYTTGPVWGRIVDSRGPRILLSCAFVFLLGGYMGMRYLFNAGLPKGVEHLPVLGFVTLVLCSYLTGAGGNGGLTSSVNSTAKSFPDQMVSVTSSNIHQEFSILTIYVRVFSEG